MPARVALRASASEHCFRMVNKFNLRFAPARDEPLS